MRYSGEHIAAMVISIISNAKNVFIPMSVEIVYFLKVLLSAHYFIYHILSNATVT